MLQVYDTGNIRLSIDSEEANINDIIQLIRFNYTKLNDTRFKIENMKYPVKDTSNNNSEKAIENITDILPKHPNKLYSNRNLDNIYYIVLHHSASTSANVHDVANFHINSRNWPGIAYHLFRDTDGTLYQVNDLETKSYHAGEYNRTSIGICIAGDFELINSNIKEIEKDITTMINWTQSKINKQLKVVYHRDVRQTLCPGTYFPKIKENND